LLGPAIVAPPHAVSWAPPPPRGPSLRCSCTNGCDCGDNFINSELTYSQQVTFMTTVRPTAAPACHVSVQLAGNATAGSKARVTGVTVTGDPGEFVQARIGEEKYMSWLAGNEWAA